MLRLGNDATPALIGAVSVPDSTPPAGLVPIATVILPVTPLTVAPPASWTATCTPGCMIAPAGVLDGCTIKPSFTAVPPTVLNEELVAAARPEAVAVSL